MAADVKAKSFVLDGASKAADVAVLFEDDDGDATCGQFIACGEACGACTDNKHGFGRILLLSFHRQRRDCPQCNSGSMFGRATCLFRAYFALGFFGGDLCRIMPIWAKLRACRHPSAHRALTAPAYGSVSETDVC